MMNMKIGTRILAGYVVALLVMGVIGIVAYRATSELVDSADWVTHTHQVKETVSEILFTLTDADTGQRGYLLTGEERYLAPYQAAVKLIDQQVQHFQELTSDNPNQQRRVPTLRASIATKLSKMAELIDLKKRTSRE